MTESTRGIIKNLKAQLKKRQGEANRMFLIETTRLFLGKRAWLVCHGQAMGTDERTMLLGHERTGMLPALIVTDLEDGGAYYTLTERDRAIVQHSFDTSGREHSAKPIGSPRTTYSADVVIPKERGSYTFKANGGSEYSY